MEMMDIRISEMMEMQQKLWENNKEYWSPIEPQYARNYILWMIEELGESIAIIKKQGDKAIMDNEGVREAFKEELSDVLMYYIEILRRYHISAEEISQAFIKKYEKNLKRNYKIEYTKKS